MLPSLSYLKTFGFLDVKDDVPTEMQREQDDPDAPDLSQQSGAKVRRKNRTISVINDEIRGAQVERERLENLLRDNPQPQELQERIRALNETIESGKKELEKRDKLKAKRNQPKPAGENEEAELKSVIDETIKRVEAAAREAAKAEKKEAKEAAKAEKKEAREEAKEAVAAQKNEAREEAKVARGAAKAEKKEAREEAKVARGAAKAEKREAKEQQDLQSVVEKIFEKLEAQEMNEVVAWKQSYFGVTKMTVKVNNAIDIEDVNQFNQLIQNRKQEQEGLSPVEFEYLKKPQWDFDDALRKEWLKVRRDGEWKQWRDWPGWDNVPSETKSDLAEYASTLLARLAKAAEQRISGIKQVLDAMKTLGEEVDYSEKKILEGVEEQKLREILYQLQGPLEALRMKQNEAKELAEKYKNEQEAEKKAVAAKRTEAARTQRQQKNYNDQIQLLQRLYPERRQSAIAAGADPRSILPGLLRDRDSVLREKYNSTLEEGATTQMMTSSSSQLPKESDPNALFDEKQLRFMFVTEPEINTATQRLMSSNMSPSPRPESSNDGPVPMDISANKPTGGYEDDEGELQNEEDSEVANLDYGDDAKAAFESIPAVVIRTDYMRYVLREHINGMIANHKAHEEKVKAVDKDAYVSNASEALRKDPNEAAEELMPVFESLLRYRMTSLYAKKSDMQRRLPLLEGQIVTQINKSISEIREKITKGGWSANLRLDANQVDLGKAWQQLAKAMQDGEEGSLPGQLSRPQPLFLPLRIAAPPRMGKSALTLLLSSLARRLGFKIFLSVAPNKKIPVLEFQEKLQKMGWKDNNKETRSQTAQRRLSQAKQNIQQNPQDPAAKKAVKNAARKVPVEGSRKSARIKFTPTQATGVQPPPEGIDANEQAKIALSESKALSWRAVVIDQLRKTNIVNSLNKPNDPIDMVFYSHDVALDVQTVGGMLSSLALSSTLVLNVHDESQRMLKKEFNAGYPKSNVIDIPPNVSASYLRHYYGNRYNLICNVTATHLPTLCESEMWGFTGTAEQCVLNDIHGSKGGAPQITNINAKLGAATLPLLVPALTPGPEHFVGYVGIDHVVTWQTDENDPTTEQFLYLDEAARSQGTASGDSWRTKINEAKKELADLAGPVNNTKSEVLENTIRRSMRSRNNMKASGIPDDDKPQGNPGSSRRTNAQKIFEENEEAQQMLLQKAKDATPAELMAAEMAAKSSNESSDKTTTTETDDEADDSDFEQLESDSDDDEDEGAALLQNSQTTISSGRARGAALWTTLDNSVETSANPGKRPMDNPNIQSVQKQTTTNTSQWSRAFKMSVANYDSERILAHFMEWFRTPKRPASFYQSETQKQNVENTAVAQKILLVPSYIGALNANISGDESLSAWLPVLATKINEFRSSEETSIKPKNYYNPNSNQTDSNPNNRELNRQYGAAFLLYQSVLRSKQKIESLSNIRVLNDNVTALPDTETGTSMLLCVYSPCFQGNDTTAQSNARPGFVCFGAVNAQQSIRFVLDMYGIEKIGIFGFTMLEAGLTVQHMQTDPNDTEKTLIFCPSHIGIVGTVDRPLDATLQTVGRTFVSLPFEKPENWKIKLLSSKGLRARLSTYSEIELALTKLKGKKLFEALRETFTPKEVVESGVYDLGTVGVRREQIIHLLGYTKSQFATASANAKSGEALKIHNAERLGQMQDAVNNKGYPGPVSLAKWKDFEAWQKKKADDEAAAFTPSSTPTPGGEDGAFMRVEPQEGDLSGDVPMQ